MIRLPNQNILLPNQNITLPQKIGGLLTLNYF